MFQKSKRCPICSGKIKLIGNTMICSECGYRLYGNSTNIHTAESPSTHTQPSANTQYSNKQNPNPSANTPYSSGNRRQNHVTLFLVFGIIAVSVVVRIVLFLQLFLLSNSSEQASSITILDENTIPSKESSPSRSLPESDMFRQFISAVFHKDYWEVTSNELATITSLELSNQDSGYRMISYTLNDGRSGTFYSNNETVKTRDLDVFTGLECLKLDREQLDKGDLEHLTNLTELWCNNSPAELAKIIRPSQLTVLGINSNFFLSSLDGIHVFDNITNLYIDGGDYYLYDISALSTLKNLTTLKLDNVDSIESFRVLYDLPQLESLSIESKTLRDIGFITNMPNLKELSIKNSDILSIEALENCKNTLTKLNLSDNYQIADYTVISELHQLTELTLSVQYLFEQAFPLPALDTMTNLTKLSIGHFDNLEPLKYAKGLTELTMTSIYTDDYSALSMLQNLTHLNLVDMSIESSALVPIMELTGLETIDMSESFIWGNVEGLLSLPNLKEFTLNSCTAGFDMEHLTPNESLTHLHMSHVTLKALINGTWDYTAHDSNTITLSEHTDLFLNYPNLIELSLAGNQLTDITFMEKLSKLEILDITDNYIVNLTPLSKLQQLQTIMCAENPIADEAGLGQKILTKN